MVICTSPVLIHADCVPQITWQSEDVYGNGLSTAAFHARVMGSFPGFGGLKETKMFLSHSLNSNLENPLDPSPHDPRPTTLDPQLDFEKKSVYLYNYNFCIIIKFGKLIPSKHEVMLF